MAIINGTDVGDFLTGTNDPDTISGLSGDDTIIGGRGNDVALLGDGNDRFVWNPGDGNDTVFGQGGFDTLEFNGANVAEQIDIHANGAAAQLTRNIANIVMDLDSVERVDVGTLGGADIVHVGDMSGSQTTQVAIDLAAFSGLGDGANDTVIADGRSKADSVHITADGFGVAVSGLAAAVTVAGAESSDTLVVNGLGGDDTINAAGMSAAAIRLTLDGGAGNDKITGGDGNDVIFGGDGNDTVTGGKGDDVALLGAGNDRFDWNKGDGNDVIEGQAGIDTVNFTGGGAADNIQIAANGSRVLMTDSDGAVTLDMNAVEKLNITTGQGAESITVGDLSGTGVTNVSIDLAVGPGHVLPDADVDAVTLNGSFPAADTIKLASEGAWVRVTGLSETVMIGHVGKNDALVINSLGGDDVIDGSKLTANQMQLTINGGAGNDTIIGSAGNDAVNGGQGSDTVLLGAGNDRFTWNPGDGSDSVNGQAGFDTLAFNGANINEQIFMTAVGSHVQFTRNVAAITMDLEQMERIEFRALGGADIITVGDMTGTGIKQVALDLGAANGGGDAAVDTVSVDFSNAKDVVKLSQGTDGVLTIASAAETITIANAESTDLLTVNGLGGNDTLDASALKAGAMGLTLNGGGGNDLIFGGADKDTLLGGDGDDSVTWSIGGGNDVIDGGTGIDTLVLNGSTGDDQIQVFANVGGKLTVTGSDGATLDVSGMEQVKVMGGAGKDSILIGDLSTTAIDKVTVDLGAGSPGEQVTVQNGVGEVMVIETKGSQTIITNQNTFQTITVNNLESSDVLNVISSFGNVPGQVIMASGLTTSLHFTGGNGADTVFAGSGDDFIDTNQGNDIVLMGAGNDVFQWDPGDGSDTVDGQAGFDTLRFNGSNASENIDILADGTHAELTRNIANIDMHLNSVERIEVRTLAGTDNVHVHDMSGTGVKEVSVNLSGFDGNGDAAVDTVTVDGTAGNDHVTMTSSNGSVTMTGLPAQVSVSGGELDDEIKVNGGDGNDTIDASGVQSGNAHMTLDGGAGNDSITGGADGDLIFGGDGHDILKGGSGADTIDGGIGNDDITGGAGDDILGGGDGANVFHYNGLLDGHDLIEGFTSQDHLDLTKLFDNLGVADGERDGRVSVTNNGFGDVTVAVDADGNTANGFEHVVATIHTNSSISVGQEVVTHG